MSERDFYPEDCISALATPWGESALAVIRVSGRGSLQRLAPLFRSTRGSLERAAGHSLLHGLLCESAGAAGQQAIDEVLVAVYRGPRSFTGEDAAEIFTHGSPVIVTRVLESLGAAGFRPAGPGEFTLRAFLNGKLDLTQAEAVNELVRAKTDRARALALSRLSGTIERAIREIKQGLVQLLAAVEVRIDYPEEELEGPALEDGELALRQEELERLLASYRIGKVYQEGITVVLAGPTNSGKSTLFNRLLREERAIVSEVHGTTRDYLEGFLSVEGIPVRLYDTAGYREARDELEREGIRRTDAVVRSAQLLLYLVDASRGVGAEDRAFLEGGVGPGAPAVVPVWSKADLADPGACPEGFVAVSARTGAGVEELGRRMAAGVLEGVGSTDGDAPVIDSLRQKELLERALAAVRELRRGLREGQPLDVLAVDLKEALDALGEITGEVSSQEILNTVFSRFCVGK
ncbi:MAG: tRNA uridine-5-carboxymethylaminomethyl(34) synthesis GTPase MnmE [Spirochaetales bacterium]|nr:tRNA uridine-5-carboxymethylaminomethyl(34) synthesis GTPase MnmE [Spirochaetales bacterium]